MSYNKNTVVCTAIDMCVYLCKINRVEYSVSVLGTVFCQGVNQLGTLPIRRFQSETMVFLERMERSHDCDCDDWLISHEFTTETEPRDWPIEIYVDDEEYE